MQKSSTSSKLAAERPSCQLKFLNWARGLDLDPAEKLLLYTFVSYVDTDDSGICWPTQAELSHVTGMSERHVRRLITRLEDDNAVHVEHRRSKRGKVKKNIYHLDPATDPTLHRTPESAGHHRTWVSSGPPDLGVRSSTGHGGPCTEPKTFDRTKERTSKKAGSSRSRSAGGKRPTKVADNRNSSSREAKRQPPPPTSGKPTPTPAEAEGRSAPRARAINEVDTKSQRRHKRPARFSKIRFAADGSRRRIERSAQRSRSNSHNGHNGHDTDLQAIIAADLDQFYQRHNMVR